MLPRALSGTWPRPWHPSPPGPAPVLDDPQVLDVIASLGVDPSTSRPKAVPLFHQRGKVRIGYHLQTARYDVLVHVPKILQLISRSDTVWATPVPFPRISDGADRMHRRGNPGPWTVVFLGHGKRDVHSDIGIARRIQPDHDPLIHSISAWRTASLSGIRKYGTGSRSGILPASCENRRGRTARGRSAGIDKGGRSFRSSLAPL